MSAALMAGKKGLIMGVANDRSIAWGIARMAAHHGAELAFTFQGEALERRVRPLAASVNSPLVLPCDVTDDKSLDATPGQLNLRERKVLELARALAARPRLLLLDEVMSGLNPAEVDNAIRLVKQIRDQGTTIVFVEHLMRAVVQLSDRVVVMNEGALLTSGSPDAVMRDQRVMDVYFGNAHAA